MLASHEASRAPIRFTLIKTINRIFMCFLCAFRISKSRTAILKICSGFTPESPSDFRINNLCDIKECNCSTFMGFLYALRISEAEPLFWKFALVSPLSHPLILESPIYVISKNVTALYLYVFYVLCEYLKAGPLFWKFFLVSPLSHPLILGSPIFAISKVLC